MIRINYFFQKVLPAFYSFKLELIQTPELSIWFLSIYGWADQWWIII